MKDGQRSVVLVIVALLAAPMVVAEPESAGFAVCPAGLRTMEGVGLVCPQPDGTYEVFSAALEPLGFIHGTDPIPAGAPAVPDPDAAESGTSVNCVGGAAGTYFIQVMYARASNDVDQYSAWAPTIRTMVGNANKLVDDAAVATGTTASLNVKCVSGVVEVLNVALPTAMASASFSTIVTDLRNLGYNDGKVKYWVFYDDTGACTCGGTGHIYSDDTTGVANLNNGNGVSFFAVDFGYNSVRTMLHELGHNMGAVQNSAPHSTLAHHCYDGLDTMCYSDGGANASLYSSSYCATEVFDCGKTDYFHANPPAGSYLATHWNLGNPVNRFITFGIVSGAPVLSTLSCPASIEEDATFSCSFVGSSGTASGVRYSVSWGDATSTSVPTSGFVSPGVSQSASKAYATPGVRTVSVSIADSNGLNGNTLTASVNAFADNPVMNLVDCPASVEEDASITCSIRASDASPGVVYTVNWGDATSSTVPTSGTVAPGVTQSVSHTYATPATRTVSVFATDTLGHVGGSMTDSVNVFADNPVMTTVSCPTRVEEDLALSCSFRATDLSPGVQYQIDWGDGAIQYVPTSGTTAPGVTQSLAHTYAAPATRIVSIRATDTYAHGSAPLTASVNVFADDPYFTILSCPARLEVGTAATCQARAHDNTTGGIRYTLAWGDASSTLIPTSGYTPANTTQSATHTYAAQGTYTVSATAVDTLGHASAPRTTSVQVVYDATPPTLVVNDPRANIAYVGCGVQEPMPASTGRPLWVQTACVRATATDARSAIARVEVYVNGVLSASDTSAPYQLEFPTPFTRTGVQVQVVATDAAGNAATQTLNVDMVSSQS